MIVGVKNGKNKKIGPLIRIYAVQNAWHYGQWLGFALLSVIVKMGFAVIKGQQ